MAAQVFETRRMGKATQKCSGYELLDSLSKSIKLEAFARELSYRSHKCHHRNTSFSLFLHFWILRGWCQSMVENGILS